jgi:hypothetical protein
MEKKQTAVEWLLEKLEGDYSKIAILIGLKEYNLVIKQAIAMEKEQITESHLQGLYSEIKMRGEKQAEQYYNETYKQQDNED